MASPFAKYQSEQVQQLAPGFVEAYGRAGASIGQGIAAVGAGVAKGMEVAEQKKLEQAKLEGALNPYIRTEVGNVEQSITNGLLVKGKDGKVTIAPGQEKNVDVNKVGRAIDLYNLTDGGKKTLKADELTRAVSTIQSYDAMEKTAAEKAGAARAAKIAELDYTSKVLGNAATLSEGISAAANAAYARATAAAQAGDKAGAEKALAEYRALSDKSVNVRFDAMRAGGIPIDSYLTPPPVPAPVRPAAAAVGSGASTLYTVPSDTDFQASLARFDTNLKAGSAPEPTPAAPAAPVAAAAPAAPAPATAVPAAGTPAAATPTPAPAAAITTWAQAAAALGETEEIAKWRGERMAGMTPAEYVASRTPAAAAEPAKPAAKPPTARQLMTGQMPAVQQAPAPVVAGQTAAAAQPSARVTTPNAAIAQAESEIKSLETAKQIYIDQHKAYKDMAALANFRPEDASAYRKLAEASFKMSLDIDEQITKKMTLISTEKSTGASSEIAKTKLSLDIAKDVDSAAPDFGGGWMSRKRADILKNYPDDPARGLANLRIGGFQGSKTEVIDILGSRASFIDATMNIENALDERLEKGGVGLFDLLTLNKGDYEAYTKGNVGEKILLASMRKAIVSGGNFSDADRTFVLEAIAAINNLNPLKREPYLKALNQTMAEMVIGLFDRKIAANGVERHLELLPPEERDAAVPSTEQAFQQRFGIDENGKASAARSELQGIISEGRKASGFGNAKASAASALDKFVADARKEAAEAAEAAKANKTK